jgi:putative ABC transport system permease protein
MSAWRHAAYLAWRYVVATPWRSLAMGFAVAVAVYLPVASWSVGRVLEDAMMARARSTPIVVGHKGDEVDLVLASLYFRGEVHDAVPYGVVARLRERHDAAVVPLHTAHSAGGVPVVGTSLAYFEARGMQVARGRTPAVVGEVMAGAEAAVEAGLEVGNRLRSDQRNLYDLSGAYPSQLTVVGILAPTGGPDDEVLFADVKTSWLLDGRLHGHAEVTEADALARDEDDLVASPALFVFTELDEKSLSSFHAHGSQASWPLTSVLVFPRSTLAHDQVLGDMAVDEALHAVRPVGVVRTVLGIVLRVQQLLYAYLALQGVVTLALLGSVVLLSLRLRADEMALIQRMGGGRGTMIRVVLAEFFWIGGGAVVLATVATGATLWWVLGVLP